MAKGSNFERDMCRRFSLWWTDGKRNDYFWRSSGSGARAKVRGRANQRTHGQHGDMCATHPAGEPFIDLLTVEMKRGYSKFTIAELIDKPHKSAQQKYEEWLQQAMESHEQSGSYAWMLIVQRDRREAIVIMPTFFVEVLRTEFFFHKPFPAVPYCEVKVRIRHKVKKELTSRKVQMSITTLSQWLKFVSPEMIQHLAKTV